MKLPRLFKRAPAQAPAPRIEPRIAVGDTRQAAPAQVRGYRAARPDRLLGGFNRFFSSTPRQELRQDVRGLVNHARAAARNYTSSVSFETLARDNVVGPDGIRMVPEVVNDRADGRDRAGAPDRMANDRIAAAWSEWARRGNCTPCRRLSFWNIERQAVTALVREGGMFFRHHRGRGPFGYMIEPLPFDLLDIDLTERRGDAFVESGIEFDADGAVLAYHLWAAPQGEPHRPGYNTRRRIPAREIDYVVDLCEVGAALGAPRGAAALRMMGLAEQFEESAMVAADMGARGVVYYQQDGSDAVGGDIAPEDAPGALEAGSGVLLPPGVTANHPTPHYPDAAVGPFLDHFARNSAASLGISAESLTSNLSGANYSSLHAGMIKERDTWRTLQRVLIEGLHEPARAEWLPLAMMSGRLRLPVGRLDKFDRATFRPRGWSAVDPLKQARADTEGVGAGITTLSEIAARKGKTVEELAAEIAADRAAFAAAGLPDPYHALATGAAAVGETPDEND